jgi:photosystem II stability/assembly factor-like uncharacterized protein
MISVSFGQTQQITKDINGNTPRQINTAKDLGFYGNEKVSSGWVSVGPFGGDVLDVAINPQNTNVIFAAGGQPYMSENGGDTWQFIDTLYQLSSTGIHTMESNSAGVIFAGGTFSSGKVFRSEDGGFSWEKKTFSISRWVNDIAVDPTDPNTIYLGVSGDAGGTSTYAMVKSVNGGDSWSPMNLAGGMPAGYDVVSLAVDPDDNEVIFAIGQQGISNGTIAASFDSGDTWENMTSNLPTGKPYNTVAIANGIVYMGGGQLFGGNVLGLYKSSNYGLSWQNVSSSFPIKVVNTILINPNDPNQVYVGTEGDGIYFSSDAGESWDFDTQGSAENGSVRNLQFKPGNTSIIYGGFLSLGVCKSTDAGNNWQFANHGIASLLLNDIEVSNDNNTILASFEAENSGGCYLSHDGGISWDIVTSLPGTRYSSVTIGIDGALYAWSNGPSTVAQEGLYKSTDGGANWENMGPNNGSLFETEVFSIASSQSDAGILFIGGNDFGVAGWASRIYKSIDGGENWTQSYIGPDNDSFHYLHIASDSEDETIYATFGNYNSPGGVLKSTNGGFNWNALSNGLPNNMKWAGAIVTDPMNNDIIYCGVGGQGNVAGSIYKSMDAGVQWESTGLNLGNWTKITDLLINPLDNNVVYAATTQNGVVVTEDAGENWQDANKNLTASNVTGFSNTFMQNDTLKFLASTYTNSAFVHNAHLSYTNIANTHFQQNNILVYPNPANEVIHIRFESSAFAQLIIYDVFGKKVWEERESALLVTTPTKGKTTPTIGTYSIKVSSWSKGLYFATLTNKDKVIEVEKIVVQ